MDDRPPSRLLELPQELRDVIYDFLLLETRKNPPETPDSVAQQVLLTTSIWITGHAGRPSLFKLRECSRRLHNEVNAFIKRRNDPAMRRAKIDIMIRGNCIWPTFTHVPLTRKPQSTVHVQLRIFPKNTTHVESGLPPTACRAIRQFLVMLTHRGANARLRPWFNLGVPLTKVVLDIQVTGFEGHASEMFFTYADALKFSRALLAENGKIGGRNLQLPDLRVVEAVYDGDKRLLWHNNNSDRTIQMVGRDPSTQDWSFRDQVPDNFCVVS